MGPLLAQAGKRPCVSGPRGSHLRPATALRMMGASWSSPQTVHPRGSWSQDSTVPATGVSPERGRLALSSTPGLGLAFTCDADPV